MALSATTITAAIAALAITGVTIWDIDEVSTNVIATDCPVLFPMPGAWLGTGTGLVDGETTFGTPSTRYWQAHRIYTYVFLHSAVGDGSKLREQYNDATAFLDAILEAFSELDTPGVDVEAITNEPLGGLSNGKNGKYIGAIFHITLLERINA